MTALVISTPDDPQLQEKWDENIQLAVDAFGDAGFDFVDVGEADGGDGGAPVPVG
jgi:hypothetical protein